MTTVYLQPKAPIGDLDKLEFMYTPQIEYSHDVKYEAYNLVHTNYQPYAYSRSENPTIGISCKFSAHTVDHFMYCEKAIRFLRTYTKMNYGRNDPQRGQPPRILRLFAYGEKMFNDVPVVISKFNMTFPEDCDYVTLDTTTTGQTGLMQSSLSKSAGGGRSSAQYSENDPRRTDSGATAGGPMSLPIIFTISISLMMQQNPSRVVNEFNLTDFALGKLSGKGYV